MDRRRANPHDASEEANEVFTAWLPRESISYDAEEGAAAALDGAKVLDEDCKAFNLSGPK
ncbi:hypothetical protein E2562_024507 [Oryza meyeriana var. granulata]|uniref:Uncharacterized protein n=1 Tax=Oryza meyeriana var. granulata TaxID=110450 RepID=A0A6G1BNL2_9ORYZ|nr:hypothetical protein E2562_024507 [Oryza meyeriana var. granulata]